MKPMLAMAVKDLRLLLRDRMGFFFTFFFPLLVAVFFGSVFSGGNDSSSPKSRIAITVVDQDNSEHSRKLFQSLSDAEELSVRTAPTVDEARNLVRRGQNNLVALVLIPPGYGEASERMFYGDPARLEVVTDPSHAAESGMLQGILMKYAFRRLQDAFANPASMQDSARRALDQVRSSADLDPASKAALEQFLPNLDVFLKDMPPASTSAAGSATGPAGWQPVEINTSTIEAAPTSGENHPSSAYAVSFPQGVMWGIIGCSLGLGMTMVTERTRGTLIRLRMAPVARWHILGGKALACLAITTAISAILMLIAGAIGVRPNSVPLLALAILCTSVCFTGLMMLTSVIGKSEQAAAGLGWSIMLLMAMIGGAMIPQFVMPGWIQALGSISPVKWAMVAMDGAIWRGYSLLDMALPCGILVAIGVITFSIGAAVFRRST